MRFPSSLVYLLVPLPTAAVFREIDSEIILCRGAFPPGIFRQCAWPRDRCAATRKLAHEPWEKEKAGTARGKFETLRAFCRVFRRIPDLGAEGENMKDQIHRKVRPSREREREKERNGKCLFNNSKKRALRASSLWENWRKRIIINLTTHIMEDKKINSRDTTLERRR